MGHLFKRGLNDRFLDLLRAEAEKKGWWWDVLGDGDLMIGIRNDYLNVYWRGQSLFKVRPNGERLSVTTHEKYLLDPELAGQIKFSGKDFEIDALVERGFMRKYEGLATLVKMKKSAGYYAGAEKQGVHEIAMASGAVVDVEIAFPDNGPVSRVDLAALENETDDAVRLVFWEAKSYMNGELRAMGDDVRVCQQIQRYKNYLGADNNRDTIESSYRRVARNLIELKNMGWSRVLDPSISVVASNPDKLTLGDDPRVGLLIFGFDAAQRDSAAWKSHWEKLERQIGKERIRAAGNPQQLRLRP